jgi:ATP-dependent Lon protease
MNQNNKNIQFTVSDFWVDEFSEVNDNGISEAVEDESNNPKDTQVPELLPILPLKNTVVFPGVIMPVNLGRKKSIKLVEKAVKTNRFIGLTAQKNSAEDPTLNDLYEIGVLAQIIKVVVMPDGSTTIIIQGLAKIRIDELVQNEPFLKAKFTQLEDTFEDKGKRENKVLIQTLREAAVKLIRLNPQIPPAAAQVLENIKHPASIANFLASNLTIPVDEKQELLEYTNISIRIDKLLLHLNKEMQLQELRSEIHQKVVGDIDQQQKEYFLRQQIKTLQQELGGETTEAELDKLRQRGEEKSWPQSVKEHYFKELDKLARINPMAAEYSMSMNYVEYLIDLPWNTYTEDNFNLKKARKVLDSDHFGLEKVKERILEYLAVLKLKGDMKAPILCLYGPPGVGKTSLGRSIAKALGRKYVRMSLGGVHDESEIRGHRRTYIGAMPGKIISNLKKVGTNNPVMILDEIDKIGRDFRGDPSAALLEVLDPEQNSAFTDNYLEVDYDLSKILFIATTNSLDSIHPALRDRMEIIDISGYTLEEKQQIAKKHLISKQLDENGLKNTKLSFDSKAVISIIENYTRESGVRSLERQIGKLIRKIALKVATGESTPKEIQLEDVRALLGAPIFDKEIYETTDVAGVVTGLAWTQVGGEILMIETSLSKGNGRMTLSGQLGDVMKESASAAMSYLRAHAEALSIDYKIFNHYDVHIHIPAGAVPKDGPSAGITLLTSLASAFTQRQVMPKLAMTGEITLRGKVLPVGGIKEKILAAKRAGIKDIIMCDKNEKDLEDVQANSIKDLTFHFVSTASQVLDLALSKKTISQPQDLSYRGEKPHAPATA